MIVPALLLHARHARLSMTASDDLLTGLDGHAIATSQLSSVLDALDGMESSNSVGSVEVTSDVLQPGSHSGVLRLSPEGGGAPRSVFLKKITATHPPMAQRPWHDRRKTLAYARTESRFYQEFAPEVAQRGVRLPKLVWYFGWHLSRP